MANPEITDARELLRRVSAFAERLQAQDQALWAATVEIQGKQFGGLIVDFSPGGSRIRFAASVSTDEDVTRVLDKLDTLGASVIWQEKGKNGFELLLAPEEVANRVRRRPEALVQKRRV